MLTSYKLSQFCYGAKPKIFDSVGTESRQTTKGFTLLEVLLSIAAITIIAGISIPIYQSFQTRNDLDIAALEIAHSVRRAQILSQAVDGDTNWGVKIQSGSITIFKGASYASRTVAFDEVFDVPTTIAPSGTQEFIFAKFSGLPTTIGTTTLSSITNTNERRTTTINAKGMVSY